MQNAFAFDWVLGNDVYGRQALGRVINISVRTRCCISKGVVHQIVDSFVRKISNHNLKDESYIYLGISILINK